MRNPADPFYVFFYPHSFLINESAAFYTRRFRFYTRKVLNSAYAPAVSSTKNRLYQVRKVNTTQILRALFALPW